MKNLLWAAAAVALVAVGPAPAGDIVYKPIDTNKLVVQPSRTVANVAAQTINVVGNTAAGSLEGNGYIKTINNLFSRKIIVPHTQRGPSPLPSPNLFPSTQYKSYNTPVMPIYAPR
ncbi:unnamed protein product [Gemmataceae bacterium]|nr:unnamed protein product [Gemmataceae bacterium]VTU02319.1 unnamed protein product [Gemmataceae bacterium]